MQTIKNRLSFLLIIFFIINNSYAQTTQIVVVDATCPGAYDGSVTVETNGCNGYFTYKLFWQNPNNGWWVMLGSTTTYTSTPQLFPSCPIGNYKIEITSQSGCNVPDELFTINSAPYPFTTTITPIDPICNGDFNGSITIETNGGNGSFYYKLYWQNPINGFWVWLGNTSSSITYPFLFSNLGAGNYWIEITNTTCTVNDEYITLTDPPLATVSAGTNQTICNGSVPNNLTANGSSTGTYSWQSAADFVNANTQNPVFANGLTTTTTYTVTYTYGNGCTATDNVTITVNPLPTAVLVATPNPACSGDDILLSVTSSIPVTQYRFQYNTGSGWVNIGGGNGWGNNSSVTYNNITQSTNFRVKVRENNTCNTSSWSPTIAVTANWLPSQTTATSQTACLGGVVPDLFAVGSLPTWYSDQALTTQVYQGNYYATGQTAVALYTYYVTETWNGCEGAAVPVTLEIYAIPSAPTATNEVACEGGVIPDLTTTVATSTPTFWYSDAGLTAVVGNGSTFATGQTAAGIYNYWVTEESANGCESAGIPVTLEIYALPITTPIWHN